MKRSTQIRILANVVAMPSGWYLGKGEYHVVAVFFVAWMIAAVGAEIIATIEDGRPGEIHHHFTSTIRPPKIDA